MNEKSHLAGGAGEHQLTVPVESARQRLDRFLADRLPELSRSRLKGLIEADQVRIGGATISEPAHRVKPGDQVHLTVPPPIDPRPKGQAIPLEILYEDSDLIVINKPAGLVVHPAPGSPDMTLVNALIAHCGAELSGIGGERRPGIVHRLDKDTSGVMVAAKNDAAHQGLAKLFAAHDIERRYQALIWGCPLPARGKIVGNIGRHPKHRIKMAVVADGHGRHAVTHYHVLQNFQRQAARIECRLETGRTHQIRVHLAHLGFPVIGDPLYGRSQFGRRLGLTAMQREIVADFKRQALHANILGFIHPISGAALKSQADLPSDMKTLMDVLLALEIE